MANADSTIAKIRFSQRLGSFMAIREPICAAGKMPITIGNAIDKLTLPW